MTFFSGEQLSEVDLIVDAVYAGYKTERGGIADPLVPLAGVSRQGGFRYRGSKERPTLLVLTSNLAEPEWPDQLDETTGTFTYYGDNRHPGRLLHDTPRFGNQLLRQIFDWSHLGQRHLVPPILVFTTEASGRTFRFRGLAVPGSPALAATEDLVALWKTSEGQRFQNYKAVFTILDEAVIARSWIHAAGRGDASAAAAPGAWKAWMASGGVRPLMAPRSVLIRTKLEQQPTTPADEALIEVIRQRYKANPYGFEACAGALTRLLLPDVSRLDLTRPWRDGGRDGIGCLRIGRGPASIEVDFALEAKCYGSNNAVGVREVSRLISRIKHREFGILVTTSYVDRQAYQEVTDDGHPVILVAAQDIVGLLHAAELRAPAQVAAWLDGITRSG
ncbi:restriction endonuclease [Paucibacter sp. KBW04]|uniref:restriction endonuclease n=1 Tax=Paucibacter sp. KBW04 TaxID=2153361 RepID=UPI000F566CDD|nr:restriction endonuclease [Paucibacter sp. KBW04]RQO61739.1 restriction endonuclease [Paucibacter sp. KBW04]